MEWGTILKIKVGVVIPIARECMIAWADKQSIGTRYTIDELKRAITECYLEKLEVWAHETYKVNPAQMFMRFANFWSTEFYRGTISNLLMMNVNGWERKISRRQSAKDTTWYVKVSD